MTNYAKRSVLQATIDFIEREAPAGTLDRMLAWLPAASRKRLHELAPRDDVPLPLLFELWNAADALLAGHDPGWVERAGAHSIDSLGVQLYGGIVRKPTPTDFLTQRISLFRLFYHAGEMEVVQEERGRAVLRLVNLEETDRLFCRRQTGGLARALELAGGGAPSVRHARCTLDGDAFCEWDLRWRA
jgi:hypothetical protein